MEEETRGRQSLAPADPKEQPSRAWWQDIQVVGGLAAVLLGLFVVLIVAVLAISLVHSDAAQVATVASSAFTVIGTLVGAYFGIKRGTDQTKSAMDQTQEAMEQTERVTNAMRQEAAKAQAFAAHVPAGPPADDAIRAARDLAFGETRQTENVTAERKPAAPG
jgi:Putative Actinobacterial Holin-X, holin superfamily III